ncbi:hypothetical protein pdam_00016718, partial [Pocillopora damicornis]
MTLCGKLLYRDARNLRIDVDGFDSLLNKYGLWSVLRIGGWVARFVHNTRRPPRERKTGPLTTEE